MSTYKTGNAVGSPAVKDLHDNAENLDVAVNDREIPTWVDRLGRTRVSIAGYGFAFDGLMERSEESLVGFSDKSALALADFEQDGADAINTIKFDWRGVWAPDTDYPARSTVTAFDADRYQTFFTMTPHRSSSSFTADLDAGLWFAQPDGIPRVELASSSGGRLMGTQFPGPFGKSMLASDRFDLLPLSPLGYDPTLVAGSNATAALQAALDAAGLGFGGRVVVAQDIRYVCDTITVPENVTLFCDLQLRTPVTDLIKVKSGARVIGRLRGQGAVGLIERLVVPAYDYCNDVYLDIGVSNSSYGVHAMHLNEYEGAPRRWSGRVRGKQMSGDGTQRGYVVLASPGHEFNLEVWGEDTPRHTLYLTNGASNNEATLHSKRAGYGDLQIASTAAQPPCMNNKITIFAEEVLHPVGNNSFPANLVGKVENTELHIFLKNSPDADGAVLFRSLAADAVCKNNVAFIYIEGKVAGQAIVRSDAGVENTVHITGSGGTTFGAAGALIGVYNYLGIIPQGSYKYALRVGKLDYSAGGLTMRGVSVSASYALTHIGHGVVNARDLGAGAVIVDNTGTPSKIEGWTIEQKFRKTETVAAGAATTMEITFDQPIPGGRKLTYLPIVPGANNSFYAEHMCSALSATRATFYVRNPGIAATDIIIDGVCYGY